MITGTSQSMKRMNISPKLDIFMDGFKSAEHFESLLGVQIQTDLKWTKKSERAGPHPIGQKGQLVKRSLGSKSLVPDPQSQIPDSRSQIPNPKS